MIKISHKEVNEDEVSITINDSFLNNHSDIEKELVNYINKDMYNQKTKNSYEKFNEEYRKVFERYISFCDGLMAYEFWSDRLNAFTNDELVYFRVEII
jgi:hypothetical protein